MEKEIENISKSIEKIDNKMTVLLLQLDRMLENHRAEQRKHLGSRVDDLANPLSEKRTSEK